MKAAAVPAHTQFPPSDQTFASVQPLSTTKTEIAKHAAQASLFLQLTQVEPTRELTYWSCACQDENGDIVEARLYNYEVNLWKSPPNLKPGTVLAIKGPYLAPPNLVFVYHPSDLQVFHPAHPRVSHLEWLHTRAWVPTALQDIHDEYTSALGDRLYKKGREAAAHFVYSRVLDRIGEVESLEGRVVIARQLLKQEYYEDALRILGEELPAGDERLWADLGRLRCEAWQNLRQFGAAARSLSSALQTNKKHLRREVSEAVERAAECVGDLPTIPELRDRVDAHSEAVEVGAYVSCAIKVAPIFSKGNGMVAVTDIRQGDVLVMEKALVTGEDHTQPRTGNKVATVAQKITQLAHRNPKYIGALVQRLCGNASSTAQLDVRCDARDMESVCAQNMFQLEDVEPELRWIRAMSPAGRVKKQQCALFAQASFFNHSCAPNCFRINVADVIIIRAGRHIAKGSELTISYVPIDASAAERARALDKWKFRCSCPRCELDVKRETCKEAIRVRAIQTEMAPLLQLIENKPKAKSGKIAGQLLTYCRQLEAAWRVVIPSCGFEDLVFPFLCAGMSAEGRGDVEDASFCWRTALRLLGYGKLLGAKSEDDGLLVDVQYVDPLTAFALGHLFSLGEDDLKDDLCRLFELLGGCRTELDFEQRIT